MLCCPLNGEEHRLEMFEEIGALISQRVANILHHPCVRVTPREPANAEEYENCSRCRSIENSHCHDQIATQTRDKVQHIKRTSARAVYVAVDPSSLPRYLIPLAEFVCLSKTANEII